MPYEKTLEVLSRAQQDLATVKERAVAIQVSLEKCENDQFEHVWLVPIPKRPKFTEKDC